MDRKGGGKYDEQSLVKQERALKDSERKKSENEPSPPPIPPKRRHVVQYMQIFTPGKSKDENRRSSGSGQDYLKQVLHMLLVLALNTNNPEQDHQS